MKSVSSWINQHKFLLALVFVGVMAAVVYLNILPNPFIWSESEIIEHSDVHKSLANIPRFFTTEYWLKEDPFAVVNNYRPLRAVTFTIEYALWKLNPLPYHVFNIILHSATSLVLFILIKKITKSFFLGFVTALLFAVHPIHTETITWTMSRDDIMATLFLLIAWWFFIKRLNDSMLGTKYLGWEMFFLILGLLSREMAVVFPFLLVVYVISFYKKRLWKNGLIATLPSWIITSIYIFYHFYFWWESLREVRLDASVRLPLLNHFFLITKTISNYIWLMIFPINLAPDHYFPLHVTISDVGVFRSLIVFALLGIFTFWSVKKGLKRVFFALVFMVLAFAPVANIIIVKGRPFGEQRAYLPSIGFCLLLAILFKKLFSKKKKLALILLVLLTSLYSYKTWIRNYDWRSPLNLWTENLKVSQTTRAYQNLGMVYSQMGQIDQLIVQYEGMAQLMAESRKQDVQDTEIMLDIKGQPMQLQAGPAVINRAISQSADIVLKGESQIHTRLADLYRDQGDYKKALYETNLAILYDPNNPHSFLQMGNIYLRQGKYEAAIFAFEKGIQLDPTQLPLHESLASAYVKNKEYQKAVEIYEELIQAGSPNATNYYLELARIYAELGNKAEARNYWQKYKTRTLEINAKLEKEMELMIKE